MQTTLRGDIRVQLAQTACCCITRIHKGFLPRSDLTLIERFKVFAVHDHFATHFENLWVVAFKTQRNRLNGLHVSRDIFPLSAIATRCATYENPLFVAQIHRKSVKLQFAIVFHGGIRCAKSQFTSHTTVELTSPFVREVRFGMNREHGKSVYDFH